MDFIVGELQQNESATREEECQCFAFGDDEKMKEMIKKHTDAKHDEVSDEFIKNATDDELLLSVVRFLLSMTFRDCQVLITVNLSNTQQHKITVVDLESKPIERIETKWLQQDADIVQHCVKMFSSHLN